MSLNAAIESAVMVLVTEWETLVRGLVAFGPFYAPEDDDRGDETPTLELTVGVSIDNEDGQAPSASWNYQTGDNSFMGGAYRHPHWAVVTLTEQSKPEGVAKEIAEQILELLAQ